MNEIGQHITGSAIAAATLGGLVFGMTQVLKLSFKITGNKVKIIAIIFSLVLGMVIAFSFPVTTDPPGEDMTIHQAVHVWLRGLVSGMMIALSALGIHSTVKTPDTHEGSRATQ